MASSPGAPWPGPGRYKGVRDPGQGRAWGAEGGRLRGRSLGAARAPSKNQRTQNNPDTFRGFITPGCIHLPGPGGAQIPPGEGLSKPLLNTPRSLRGWGRVGTLCHRGGDTQPSGWGHSAIGVGTFPPVPPSGTRLSAHTQPSRRDLQVLCPRHRHQPPGGSPGGTRCAKQPIPAWSISQGQPRAPPSPWHCDLWHKMCFGCAVSSFSGGADETMQELLCNLMELKKKKKISYSAT